MNILIFDDHSLINNGHFNVYNNYGVMYCCIIVQYRKIRDKKNRPVGRYNE